MSGGALWSMRRALAVAAALAVLAPAGAFAQGSAEPAPRWDAVSAAGRAVPAHAAEMGVLEPGLVVSVADLGSAVAEGEPVLALDAVPQEAQLAQAQAGRDAAAAAAAQAASNAERAAAAVDAATAAVAQVEARLEAAKAGVDRALAAVDQATATKDDLPYTASKALERQAKAGVDVAQAAVAEAKASRDAASAALDQARAELAGAIAAKSAAEHAASAAAAEVARADGGIAAAEAAVARRTLLAPFGGVIASVDIRVGEYAAPGIPLIRIGDPSGWTFETTDLGAADAARIAPGDPATVTVDELFGIEIPAVVREVGLFGAEWQGDITYRVILDPAGPVPPEIRWNTVVTIAIQPGGGASPAPGS